MLTEEPPPTLRDLTQPKEEKRERRRKAETLEEDSDPEWMEFEMKDDDMDGSFDFGNRELVNPEVAKLKEEEDRKKRLEEEQRLAKEREEEAQRAAN